MTVPPTTLGPRVNATAVPASSKTAISAGTCRPKSPSITRGLRVRNPSPSTGESLANLTSSSQAAENSNGPRARFQTPRAPAGAVARSCATEPTLHKAVRLEIQLACLMPGFRYRAGGGDDRPFWPTVHPARSFRPLWPHLDPAACRSLLPASSQSPAAYFCGARSLVLSVGPRRTQCSSSARLSRTVPPLLPQIAGRRPRMRALMNWASAGTHRYPTASGAGGKA